MAELTGWPTDGAEGSVSSEARWRKMARLWAPSGVASGLAPTLGAGVINVTAGAAWVDGHFCELTSPASESSTANGLLVVRFTPADNTFELVYRDGITTPTQSEAVWELPIAQMTAGVMTDRRTFTGPGGTWQTWTPTYVDLTPGASTVIARYALVGQTVFFYFQLTVGAGAAIGSSPDISVPIQPAANQTFIGPARYVDANGSTFRGVWRIAQSTPTFIFRPEIQQVSGTGIIEAPISATAPFNWAGSDQIILNGFYEAAV